MFWDDGVDAGKEETADVLTYADQGGSEDAIEEDQNNFPNSSIERQKSNTSDEFGTCRDQRYISQNYHEVNDHHSQNTRLIF